MLGRKRCVGVGFLVRCVEDEAQSMQEEQGGGGLPVSMLLNPLPPPRPPLLFLQ